MPKAVISNRIYLDLPENKKELFNALTYRIIKENPNPLFDKPETVRTYKLVTPTIVSIPQGRLDLIPKDYEIIDKRCLAPINLPAPTYNLFDAQQIIYDQVHDSAVINALVGWGKSAFALHTIKKYQQKALVLVHTTALRDQWVEGVEDLYGFTPGVIGSGKLELDKDIVIGNVQSVVKVVQEISKVFGTVVVDECHHITSTTFSKIVDNMHARYRLALSGTLKRTDGRHVMFQDYFGHNVFKPEQSNTMNPTIKVITKGPQLPQCKTWADSVTALFNDPDYRGLISSMALIYANKGYKVLVLAERVEFLKGVSDLIGERSVTIVGETKERKEAIGRIESGESDIICGSRNIFSEGISVNQLSCVILAGPIAGVPNLEQIIGRVMRKCEGKLDPIVIDIQFSGAMCKRQNTNRLGFYLSKGWKVESV